MLGFGGVAVGSLLTASLLSGLSTPLGAWIVVSARVLSDRFLAYVLALASGVMVTMVFTELAPTGIHMVGPLSFAAGAGSGAVALGLLRSGLGGLNHRSAGDTRRLRFVGWFIALAMALHDIPEGMAIGAGDAVGHELGLVIALAIALHNIPEGMSIAAPLHMGGVRRRRILMATLFIGFVTPLGTLASVWLGRMGPTWSAFILALASGAMLYVVGRDTLPEALRAGRIPTAVGLLSGVILMLALASIHGM